MCSCFDGSDVDKGPMLHCTGCNEWHTADCMAVPTTHPYRYPSQKSFAQPHTQQPHTQPRRSRRNRLDTKSTQVNDADTRNGLETKIIQANHASTCPNNAQRAGAGGFCSSRFSCLRCRKKALLKKLGNGARQGMLPPLNKVRTTKH